VRIIVVIYFVFILPGFSLMYYWRKDLDFITRTVIGSLVSCSLIGILSYYLGVIGLNIKYHVVVLPLLLIVVGVVVLFRSKE